jgi:putative Holliday junction resolvase
VEYLGIDYGEKRIGLSFADALRVAMPLPALLVSGESAQVKAVLDVIRTRGVTAVVVGYPLNMDGSAGSRACIVDAFASKLAEASGLPVHKVDERLSSHQVEADLNSWGLGGKKKTIRARQQARKTGDVDSRAATLILQDFLEELA